VASGHDRFFGAEEFVHRLAFDVLAALQAIDGDIEFQRGHSG